MPMIAGLMRRRDFRISDHVMLPASGDAMELLVNKWQETAGGQLVVRGWGVEVSPKIPEHFLWPLTCVIYEGTEAIMSEMPFTSLLTPYVFQKPLVYHRGLPRNFMGRIYGIHEASLPLETRSEYSDGCRLTLYMFGLHATEVC